MPEPFSMDPQQIAQATQATQATQRALLEVVLRAYEEAGLAGVCAEGRWEVAIGALRDYDTRTILSHPPTTAP